MKTKTTHTPGPWTYQMEKRRQFGQIIHLAHILPAGPDAAFAIARLDPVTKREHAEANARLIAAAPELLEAAKVILVANKPSHEQWTALALAIAKAEGK